MIRNISYLPDNEAYGSHFEWPQLVSIHCSLANLGFPI
jgi:hypothetical protein